MNQEQLNRMIMKYIVIIFTAILIHMNFSSILNFARILYNSVHVLVIGGMIAFVLNLIMIRIEKLINHKGKKSYSRVVSLLLSLLIAVCIIYLLIVLVIPTVIDASQVLTKTVPPFITELQKHLQEFIDENNEFSSLLPLATTDINDLVNRFVNIFTNGIGNIVSAAINAINVVLSSVFNGILAMIFAIYILMDKERFVRLYHRLTDLYLKPLWKEIISKVLSVVYQTFSAFIGGQCIEAVILGTLCAIGMMILRMPYPLMIGTIVGVINIIPMIGAYIGGAIGMFLVFTVNPMLSIGFLIYLIILQQIESNLIYPRVVGKSVGLPGIYVMMSVVVFGSLAGIPGMLLGIPTIASIYKLFKMHVEKKEQEKQNIIHVTEEKK